MERTVLQAFMSIRNEEFRKFVFANLDQRYLDDKVYTLGSALTFGVNTGGMANWKIIQEYLNTLINGEEIPIHKHDCNDCIYLGEFNKDDLYYHPIGAKTLIARYGQNGDYQSGLWFAETEQYDLDSSMGEAYRRAKFCKLI